MWGQMQENAALEQYKAVSGNTVAPIELHLFPCGILGSTPDGIITEGPAIVNGCGVLEIKCPCKYREMIAEQMVSNELGGKEERQVSM